MKLLLLSLAYVSTTVGLSSDSFCKTMSGSEVSGSGSCAGGDIFLKGQYLEVGIHMSASFGTANDAPSSSAYGPQQLGFIADFDKNGWEGSPGYAGDYFIPGTPLEGWVVQFVENGTEYKAINEGLMGRIEVTPVSAAITSTNDTQSASWEGQLRNLKISKVTQFSNNDLYFTTSVTLMNTGSTPLTDVYYQRTVDPDMEQPYYGEYSTLNYVKFQPAAADGSDSGLDHDYVNPLKPFLSLVCTVGVTNKDFYLGMASNDPNIRVSHFGFDNPNPAESYGDGAGNTNWHGYGGNDMQPTDAYQSRMEHVDGAIHLTYKKLSLAPGENATFHFVHVLNDTDLTAALAALDAISTTTSVPTTEPTTEPTATEPTANEPTVQINMKPKPKPAKGGQDSSDGDVKPKPKPPANKQSSPTPGPSPAGTASAGTELLQQEPLLQQTVQQEPLLQQTVQHDSKATVLVYVVGAVASACVVALAVMMRAPPTHKHEPLPESSESALPSLTL